MLFEFKKVFEKAEPFIYVIKDDLYYIGVSVCRKCNEDEKRLYKEFLSKYSVVKKTQYPAKSNIVQLVELYEQIVNHPESNSYNDYYEALKDMAFRLSDDEINNILNQRNIVTDIYNYKRAL